MRSGILYVLVFCTLTPASLTFSQNGIYAKSLNAHLKKHFPEISIVAVGDLMLGSWVKPILQEQGAFYPFEETSQYFKSSDLTIANLEAPFTDNGVPFEKQFNFKVPPKYARGLLDAGIEVVTLANNHTMDYGETGLISTLRTLDSLGVHRCGAGRNSEEAHRPAVTEINGLKIAFFGYSMTFPAEFYATTDSPGTAYPEPAIMSAKLRAWEDSVDFTVVSFHWSAEKREMPKEYQTEFAHLAIDAGADLVLGHHPHVLQGLEIYKNRLIAYSLGNYVFGSYSKHSVDSVILKTYLRNDGLLNAQLIPINVNNRQVEFQPRVLSGEAKAAVIEKLQKLSRPLNNSHNIISDSGLILGEWMSTFDGLFSLVD